MERLGYEIEETYSEGGRGYHFRVLRLGEQGDSVVYHSAQHAEELSIPPEGYPNEHLANAVAQVVRRQLAVKN